MTELAEMIDRLSVAPFTTDLVEADEVLWGTFWHFDVISPGYRLPAVELALLRATRLDGHWPVNTSLAEYLADLHQTVRHPQAWLWLLSAAGEPCVVVAAPAGQRPDRERYIYPGSLKSLPETQSQTIIRGDKQEQPASKTPQLVTVVWYCASTGQLHAGYRTTARSVPTAEKVEHRLPADRTEADRDIPPGWLVLTAEQINTKEDNRLVARLDAEILRWRLRGLTRRSCRSR